MFALVQLKLDPFAPVVPVLQELVALGAHKKFDTLLREEQNKQWLVPDFYYLGSFTWTPNTYNFIIFLI